MKRVLIGVRGVEVPDQMKQIVGALQQVKGINKAASHNLGQVEVEYDETSLTTMDLIRTVREQGFLAGML